MGRVSRYKKVKKFDPFSKQNGGKVSLNTVGIWGLGCDGRKPKKRSRTAEKLREAKRKRRKNQNANQDENVFDAPPSTKDEFDLSDMVGSLKKEKPKQDLLKGDNEHIQTIVSAGGAVLPKTDLDEQKTAKLLKIDTEPKKSEFVAERMEGESKGAYNRRVKSETRQIMMNEKTSRRNPEKRQRKNEFLKNKRNKKRGRASIQEHGGADEASGAGGRDDKNDSFITGEQAVAAVKFGEQAERPPVFHQLPRGASKKAEKQARSKKMGDKEISAEQKAMEMMRRQVQAQYAVLKAKRKQNGEFHL